MTYVPYANIPVKRIGLSFVPDSSHLPEKCHMDMTEIS